MLGLCRPRVVVLLAIVSAIVLPVATPRPVAAEEIQFYVGPSIDAEDAMYIREGIRLGQDYAEDRLGAEIETQTIVNAVPAAPRANVDLIGLSTSHALVIYTGSDLYADVLRAAYRFCERTRNRWWLVGSAPSAVDALPQRPDDLSHLARSLDTSATQLRDEYRRVTRRARRVVERLFYGKS